MPFYLVIGCIFLLKGKTLNTRFNLTLRTSRKCRLSGSYVDARTGALFFGEDMNCFKAIIELQEILFPQFYTVKDSKNNEYIFLKTGDSVINSLHKVTDKTQLEAYENHFHICDKVKKSVQQTAFACAKLITSNLIEQLKIKFPNKKFYVYFDCNFKEHIIIRFH